MKKLPKNQAWHDPNQNPGDKRFPFDKGKKHMKDTVVDREGKLVYEDKRWKPLDEMEETNGDKVKSGQSPVTEMVDSGICDGVLHLTGSFLEKHKEEILHTIRNAEKSAVERDAMNKIENIEESETDITVYTVKNRLAVTIGRKLDSAFKGGKLDITWSEDDKPAEVKWHKELEE